MQRWIALVSAVLLLISMIGCKAGGINSKGDNEMTEAIQTTGALELDKTEFYTQQESTSLVTPPTVTRAIPSQEELARAEKEFGNAIEVLKKERKLTQVTIEISVFSTSYKYTTTDPQLIQKWVQLLDKMNYVAVASDPSLLGFSERLSFYAGNKKVFYGALWQPYIQSDNVQDSTMIKITNFFEEIEKPWQELREKMDKTEETD